MLGRVRSRWEKTARSPGAAGAGGRRRRRPAGPLCAARVRARAKAARSWVSLGLGSKRITRRAMTSTSVSLAWSLPDSTNLSPVEVMAGRSFSPAQVRERASARRGPLRVTAPVGAARTGSARKSIAEGSDERPGSTGERRVRAPGLPKYLSTISGHVQVKLPWPTRGTLRDPGDSMAASAAAASGAPGCSSIARAKQSGP